MRRPYGSGQIYEKSGAYYAHWRTAEPIVEIVTVDQAVKHLRERIAIEGARLSYRQNCESMQRVHISPAMGSARSPRSRPAMSSGSQARCSRLRRSET